jgi:hypothetical protein
LRLSADSRHRWSRRLGCDRPTTKKSAISFSISEQPDIIETGQTFAINKRLLTKLLWSPGLCVELEKVWHDASLNLLVGFGFYHVIFRYHRASPYVALIISLVCFTFPSISASDSHSVSTTSPLHTIYFLQPLHAVASTPS